MLVRPAFIAVGALSAWAAIVRLTQPPRPNSHPRGPDTPTPTLAQARWQHDEIMALCHFNMATFFHNGDPGCDSNNWLGCDPDGGCNASDPASFAPTALNVSNWADSMDALGVTQAVLTAKHGCGFYIWPTRVQLPDGTRYPYAVNESLNVLQQFSDVMTSRGLGHGFYYSLTNSACARCLLSHGGVTQIPIVCRLLSQRIRVQRQAAVDAPAKAGQRHAAAV